MMPMSNRGKKYFNSNQLNIVKQAVSISEDVVNDYFRLTLTTWKKYRYDIRTLKDLAPEEIVADAFAQIKRYGQPAPPEGLRKQDFFRICIQDHNILVAQEREPDLGLLPLLTYVITHELVHIIRFYRYDQNFVADERAAAAEESLVHQLTYDLLKSVTLENLSTILEYYADHRQMVY